MLQKIRLEKILITFILLNFSYQLSFKRWVSTPTSNIVISNPEPAFNLPWYSDDSETYTCIGNIISQSYVKEVGYNKTSLQFQMKGSVNTATCFDFTAGGSNYRLVSKIVSTSNVYDFNFMLHCGNIMTVQPWMNDENKPSIKNGVSCHCPGGASNAQFAPCPFQVKTNGTFSYKLNFPQGLENPIVTMCHSLNARGQAKNCIFSSSETTDYYLKFISDYEMIPLFQLKEHHIKELVMKVIIYNSDNNIIFSEKFPLTLLDPILLRTPADSIQISLQSLQTSKSTVTGYSFITSSSNFTDLSTIYTIDNDLINPYSDFDPEKLCYIKKKNGFPLEFRKWMIDDKFTEAFLPEKCYNNAEGKIQNPFSQFTHLFNPSNIFSARFSADSYDLFPGETSLLKEMNEVAMTYNFMFDHEITVETQLNTCEIKTFSYVCQDSLNQDGFHCDMSFSTINKGQAFVLINDSNTIVQVFNTEGGVVYKKALIIDPLYTSDTKITVCMGCTYNNVLICSTSHINYNDTNNIDQPNITDPDVSNGNNSGGSGVKNSDGSLKLWLRLVIGFISAAFFLFIVYLIWPLIAFMFMCIRNGSKKIHKKFQELSNSMKEPEKSQSDIEELREYLSKK